MNTFSVYRPLIVVLVVCAALAGAMALDHTHWRWVGWMHYFMGAVFVIFSLFKLIDLSGFMTGLKKYDLIAQRFPGYALLYPFIELVLGLGYIACGPVAGLNIATLVFTLLNTLTVAKALRQGLDVRCACLGTAFNLPLSSVSLTENALMAAMAAVMLWGGWHG